MRARAAVLVQSAEKLASAFPTARLIGVIVHRLEDTPFCFASFGMQEIAKERSEMKPRSLQNHLRGRLEGPWDPIGAPSEKKVGKKRRKAPKSPSLFELCFALLPKMGGSVFEGISGWSPNRLFEDSGGQNHQKGMSKRSLFGAFSARGGFLKNVLPSTRELNSQGPTLPNRSPKLCFFVGS